MTQPLPHAPYPQLPQPPPMSTLAIIGFVLSLVCTPIGFVLSIIALVRINKSQGRLGGQGLAIAGTAIGAMSVVSIAIMTAIAIPNFVKFQCRSKQSEAKSNLKALYVAEESFRAEENRYGSLQEIGFAPRGNRLRYEYVVTVQDDTSFEATARSTSPDVAGDVWTINQDNQLQNVTNACQ